MPRKKKRKDRSLALLQHDQNAGLHVERQEREREEAVAIVSRAAAPAEQGEVYHTTNSFGSRYDVSLVSHGKFGLEVKFSRKNGYTCRQNANIRLSGLRVHSPTSVDWDTVPSRNAPLLESFSHLSWGDQLVRGEHVLATMLQVAAAMAALRSAESSPDFAEDTMASYLPAGAAQARARALRECEEFISNSMAPASEQFVDFREAPATFSLKDCILQVVQQGDMEAIMLELVAEYGLEDEYRRGQIGIVHSDDVLPEYPHDTRFALYIVGVENIVSDLQVNLPKIRETSVPGSVRSLVSCGRRIRIVGIDAEWSPRCDTVDKVQWSAFDSSGNRISRMYHIDSEQAGLALKDFLLDLSITFTGVKVGQDLRRIARRGGFEDEMGQRLESNESNVVESGHLAVDLGVLVKKNPSLATLVSVLLEKTLPKDQQLRCGDHWAQEDVSVEQQAYALKDAEASIDVLLKIVDTDWTQELKAQCLQRESKRNAKKLTGDLSYFLTTAANGVPMTTLDLFLLVSVCKRGITVDLLARLILYNVDFCKATKAFYVNFGAAGGGVGKEVEEYLGKRFAYLRAHGEWSHLTRRLFRVAMDAMLHRMKHGTLPSLPSRQTRVNESVEFDQLREKLLPLDESKLPSNFLIDQARPSGHISGSLDGKEHLALLEGIHRHGTNWSAIANEPYFRGNRSTRQLEEHWQKYCGSLVRLELLVREPATVGEVQGLLQQLGMTTALQPRWRFCIPHRFEMTTVLGGSASIQGSARTFSGREFARPRLS